MRVNNWTSSHEGRMSSGAGHPWQNRQPTWRENIVGRVKWVSTLGWQVVEYGVARSRAPFMAPLVCDPCPNISDDGGTWRSSPPDRVVLITNMRCKVFPPPQSPVMRIMADRCPLFRVGSTDRANCSRCR